MGALTPGTPPNRLLRFGLGVLALLMSLVALRNLLLLYPWGVDLEIPLRAADRWLAGGQPYLGSAFSHGPGYELPFLYPPLLLPIVAPLTPAPRVLAESAWFLVCVAGASFALHRLAVPARWWPLLFVWPPFAEGLLGGNIQILLFAAFAALLWRRPGRADLQPRPYDPAARERPALLDGLLGIAIGALKVSQVHPLVYLLRRRPRAAVVGVAALALLTVATLPLTGTGRWLDWFAQVQRAADPTWAMGGQSLASYLPRFVAYALTAVTLVLVFLVPVERAGAWVGVLSVVGAPALHTFGLLFLLPAMLAIRREISLVAALSIATYTAPGWWFAIALVGLSLLGAERVVSLREPVSTEERPVRDALGTGAAAATTAP